MNVFRHFRFITLVTLIAVFFSSIVCGESTDLLSAYQDAVKNDPTFHAQKATLEEAEQSTAVARADLLPQLFLSAQVSQSEQKSKLIGNNSYNSNQYALNFSQSIFNLSAFKRLYEAKASVQGAAALFSAEEQDLIVRLVRGYLNVLEAHDLKVYTKSQMKFAWHFYQMTRRRYYLRHATITDIDQAKEQYELLRSQYITAQIDYYRSVQDLSNITGVSYQRFSGFVSQFPLVYLDSKGITRWVSLAKRQNLFLRAAQFDMIAARRKISETKSNLLPTVSAITDYSDVNQLSSGQRERIKSTEYGVNASWNFSQGGLTLAQIHQANAAYDRAVALMQQRYLEATTNARNAYIGVQKGVLSVEASRSAVHAGLLGLKHTHAGFRAGVQSIFDLLQSQNRLFTSEKQYVTDFYRYLLDTILLKQAAGTLSPEDVYKLNRLMKFHPWRSATLIPAPRMTNVIYKKGS